MPCSSGLPKPVVAGIIGRVILRVGSGMPGCASANLIGNFTFHVVRGAATVRHGAKAIAIDEFHVLSCLQQSTWQVEKVDRHTDFGGAKVDRLVGALLGWTRLESRRHGTSKWTAESRRREAKWWTEGTWPSMIPCLKRTA
jgi:hypothetical protein